MSENMKRFLELISKDENLKKKMMELDAMAPEKGLQETIALAKKHGIELSEADFAEEETIGELSDDELDAVAGGACSCSGSGSGGCSGSGGSSGTSSGGGCFCPMYGQGNDGADNPVNCLCFISGSGSE